MGLASALTTALTGLSAAETQIDVVGNNLANSQTVGFKASDAVFATQFLQTFSLGSGPTANNGGTNPRQTGFGVQVAEITPNFSQGAVEISSNASDLAIQGDGFFIVEGRSGEQLYTRNGIFKTNANNELVTSTGHRVLGFRVDDAFNIVTSQLDSLQIPLGAAAVAEATQNVVLEGILNPVGDLADTAEVIESEILGDSATPSAAIPAVAVATSPTPASGSETITHVDGGGALQEGQTYRYRLAYVDDGGTESTSGPDIVVTVPAGNAVNDNQVTLGNLPLPASGQYSSVNIYRTSAGGTTDFGLLGNVGLGSPFTDTGAASGAALDTDTLNGNYTYLVTYHLAGSAESRPSVAIGPTNVVDGRIQLTDLPTPPVPPVGGAYPAYNEIRIYRNLASDPSNYYLVDTVAPGTDYTDSKTDAEISDLTNPANKLVDLDGPKINGNTLLVNVLRRNGLNFENVYAEGELSFAARKGDRQLSEQTFTVTATSTVQELVNFMEDSMGIQLASDDPTDPIPGSQNLITPGGPLLGQGGSIQNGRLRFVANNGVDNALDIGLSAFQLTANSGAVVSPSIGFNSIQSAAGESDATEVITYDSLGAPVKVRLTTVLESRTGTQTTFRWFADSPDNDPTSGNEIAVGTGLVTFDAEGNLVGTTNDQVSVERNTIASLSPLDFDLDFSTVSALADENGSINVKIQDGSPPGTLASYNITENGLIRGVFTNGVSRTLGSIRLARFANPSGLDQRGQNMFATASNSGLPIEGNPGENGIGGVLAGAVELSNTDIGQNLIDLVMAQTQFRGNTRVISTAQQLFDELLNLRR